MKRLFTIFIFTLLIVTNTFAFLIIAPLDKAIKTSDLIVIGTLKDISETEENFEGTAKIVVDQVIAGNTKTSDGSLLKPSDKLQLRYVESFACVAGSHRRIENIKGVFLLKLKNNGEIESEDFRLLEDLPQITRFLKKGIKPQKTAPSVKTFNEIEKVIQTEPNKIESTPTFYISHSTKIDERNSLVFVFLTILASFSLYYFLYRSRFKIR